MLGHGAQNPELKSVLFFVLPYEILCTFGTTPQFFAAESVRPLRFGLCSARLQAGIRPNPRCHPKVFVAKT